MKVAQRTPFKGESKGRRQGTRHHIEMHSASHRASDTSNPFAPSSSSILGKQFPSANKGLQQYVRNPIKRQYRNFMRSKTPYRRG